ncbi:glycosyltransferase family 4 protein [Phocaeicola sp.]
MKKVLIVATSQKTRGGITSVVKAHKTGKQWKKYNCKWIETHRDGKPIYKLWYFVTALLEFVIILPFYNIVHIHAGLRTSINRKIIFAQIAKLYGKKIIIHFHPATEKHLFDNHFKFQIERLFNYSNLLLVLSPQWIRWINEAYPNNNYNLKVLYNPCPQVHRDFSKKEKNILFAGTLNERKGYNRLLEAFSKITQSYPEWKIIFAGNGEIEKAKELQKELNIPDKQVVYLGWISGSKKEDAFQKASIYCLPSWGEGFPMGVLDAWSYGVPVITTPVGGIIDIMQNGVNGLIYDTYQLEALATCLKTLIESEDKRYNIIKEADKLVNNEFNIDKINKQLEDIYSKL